MANIKHNVLTGTDLHEPKGIASATSGQVYKANGAGSGSWSDSIVNVHGDIGIINNATATAVTAAADATLNTDTDYKKITAGWASAHLLNTSFNVDELVFNVAGEYKIHFWCTIKIPAINNFVGVKYAINDTIPFSTRKIVAQSSTANDYVNMAAFGIITGLSVNDTLSMYIAATKTDNLVVEEAGLLATYLHA